jgi:hypothetical protein
MKPLPMKMVMFLWSVKMEVTKATKPTASGFKNYLLASLEDHPKTSWEKGTCYIYHGALWYLP